MSNRAICGFLVPEVPRRSADESACFLHFCAHAFAYSPFVAAGKADLSEEDMAFKKKQQEEAKALKAAREKMGKK